MVVAVCASTLMTLESWSCAVRQIKLISFLFRFFGCVSEITQLFTMTTLTDIPCKFLRVTTWSWLSIIQPPWKATAHNNNNSIEEQQQAETTTMGRQSYCCVCIQTLCFSLVVHMARSKLKCGTDCKIIQAQRADGVVVASVKIHFKVHTQLLYYFYFMAGLWNYMVFMGVYFIAEICRNLWCLTLHFVKDARAFLKPMENVGVFYFHLGFGKT